MEKKGVTSTAGSQDTEPLSVLCIQAQDSDATPRKLVEGQLWASHTCCNNVSCLQCKYILKCTTYSAGKTNKQIAGGENRVTSM